MTRAPQDGDAVPVRPGTAGPGASVDERVAGLLAAHDLAAAGGPDGGEPAVAVQVQLERTLRSAGVDRVPVSPGDLFDPAFHLAVATETTERAADDRHVCREVRAGWMTSTGVLRPAEVVVWMAGTP